MKDNVFFVSGIDTNVGKSYATGYLAKTWNGQGVRTITQKFIQTGNVGMSEDIELHRKIMGTGLLPEDESGLTMPEIFTYPCSPHLAAEIDHRPIDFDKIEKATRQLSETYDAVLLEGAGGLMVPLTRDLLTIDYVAQKNYPLIFVTFEGIAIDFNETQFLKAHSPMVSRALFSANSTVSKPMQS